MNLFDRNAELIMSNGFKFRIKDGVRFIFHYSTFNSVGTPFCELELVNISRSLIKQIKEDDKAIFNIGYGSTLGELCSGDVKNLKTDGLNISFDIMSDFSKYNEVYSQWYDRYVREDFIVEDIASNLNLFINGSELLNEYRRPNGYTVTGPGLTSIIKLCNNRGLSVTTRGNIIEIYKQAEENTLGNVIFNSSSGLIDVNKYLDDDNKYDYVIKALPIPTLAQGDLIQVDHFKLKANCKIYDYEVSGRRNWTANYYVKVVG